MRMMILLTHDIFALRHLFSCRAFFESACHQIILLQGVENPGISYSELHFLIPDSRAVFDLIFTLSHITHH
jgi:hypothetical protein